jgi:hypothetical protein
MNQPRVAGLWVATIGCGTSNTHVTAWRGDRAITHTHRSVSLRGTALTGSRVRLQEALRDAMLEGIALVGVLSSALLGVIASGMISSPLGLYEAPHVSALACWLNWPPARRGPSLLALGPNPFCGNRVPAMASGRTLWPMQRPST